MSRSAHALKKILILTPRFPYPVIGGDRLRIYEICRELAKEYSLTLLSLCETRAELNMEVPDDDVFASVQRVYLPRWRSLIHTAMALLGSLPLQVAYYRSARFAKAFQKLVRQHDLVLAHLIRTGAYVHNAGIPAVLEMTDAISLNYHRVKSAKANSWKSLIYSLEAERLADYERIMSLRFDTTVLVSDVDKTFLEKKGRTGNLLTCSNGVDIDKYRFVWREQPRPVLAFIGNMNTLQNFDACHFFCTKVLPRLRQKGDFRLRIVGRISDTEASRFAKVPGVEIRANVPDITVAVEDCFAGVAPMRLGAGVQNKILEYMALGLPCISTVIGHEGLRAVPGQQILLADSAEEFALACERAWQDRTLAENIARAARAYVELNHSWSSQLAPLTAEVRRLLTHGDITSPADMDNPMRTGEPEDAAQ